MKTLETDAEIKADGSMTLLSPLPACPPQEETLLDTLKRLRQLGTFSEIDDPVAWQREIRKDRPFPGRN